MKQANIHQDERGMAAVIVTIVLMTVITLITIGFSQTIRREQRNVIDHQLASQAYYAAESGVNLAQSKLKSILAAGGTVTTKSNCDESYPAGNFTGEFNIASGIDITCLLIQPKVSTLEYQKVDMHAIPMLVKADSGTISTITISWQAPGNSVATSCPSAASNNFSPTTGASPNWACEQPLLRLDLVPLPDSGLLTRNTLITQQFTSFLYPIKGGAAGIIGYAAGSMTGNNAVSCGTISLPAKPKSCTATITIAGLPVGYGQSFAVRVMSIYGPADVTVYANTPGTTNLVEQQVLIDVTAKAQDVLRRVQVRASLSGSSPDFGVLAGGDGSGGVCKRYAISAGTVLTPSGYPACDLP